MSSSAIQYCHHHITTITVATTLVIIGKTTTITIVTDTLDPLPLLSSWVSSPPSPLQPTSLSTPHVPPPLAVICKPPPLPFPWHRWWFVNHCHCHPGRSTTTAIVTIVVTADNLPAITTISLALTTTISYMLATATTTRPLPTLLAITTITNDVHHQWPSLYLSIIATTVESHEGQFWKIFYILENFFNIPKVVISYWWECSNYMYGNLTFLGFRYMEIGLLGIGISH